MAKSKYPQDLTGIKFSKLTPISPDPDKNGNWLCKCDCESGRMKSISRRNLIAGHIESCGCLRDKSSKMIGQKYGMLTVTGISEERKRGYRQCICECDCGKKGVLIPSEALRRLRSTSCGCKQEKALVKARKIIEAGAVDNTNIHKLNNELASNNTSGVKGVSWHKRKKRWMAYITFKKHVYTLGYFYDIDEAAKIRKNAEQMTHEAFLEWYEKHKDNLDDAPESPDGAELEKKIKL